MHLVDSDEAYKELLKALNDASLIAFDTETTGTDPMRDEMVGMSFSVKAGEGWYLPTAPPTPSPVERREREPSWRWGAGQLDPTSPKFEPIALALQNKKSQLVCHNAKFDLGVLKNLGVEIHKPVLDTMLAQFSIDPGGQSLGLKNLAFTLLGWQMTEISELIGKGKKQITHARGAGGIGSPVCGGGCGCDDSPYGTCCNRN